MLHSGSRGAGNNLAMRHIDAAKGLMARYFIELPDPDLAYLVQDTPESDAYIRDLNWAQAHAYGNRQRMMDVAADALIAIARVALIDWDEAHVDVPDLDLVLPHNAAGLDDGAHDIAAQASAAWEAAVCWNDEYAVRRLAEVRAVRASGTTREGRHRSGELSTSDE